MPHLTETVEELDGVIGETREVQSTHDIHNRKLRNRLVAGLQSVYGADNLVLLEFGLKPRLPQKLNRLTKTEREAAKLAEAQRIVAAAAGKQE